MSFSTDIGVRPSHEYYRDCTEFGDFFVCLDCGAYADSPEAVQHHLGCVPGDAARWAKYYEEANRDVRGFPVF